jgi:hypothetical protein
LRKTIGAVDWFEHHRKEPTPKLLEAELRKILAEIEELVSEE